MVYCLYFIQDEPGESPDTANCAEIKKQGQVCLRDLQLVMSISGEGDRMPCYWKLLKRRRPYFCAGVAPERGDLPLPIPR